MQPFRAPMFRNLKPKYRGAGDDYPTITLEHCQRGDCKKLHKLARGIPIDHGTTEAALLKEPAPVKRDVATVPDAVRTPECKAYLAHVTSIRRDGMAGKLNLRKRKDGTFDQSAIDVLAAQRMRMTGHTYFDIANGVAQGCNIVRNAEGDRPKANPHEFGNFAAETAAKIDIAHLKHQVKYRIADERAGGVVSPVIQREEEKAKANAPESTQQRVDRTREMLDRAIEQARAKREQERSRGHGMGM